MAPYIPPHLRRGSQADSEESVTMTTTTTKPSLPSSPTRKFKANKSEPTDQVLMHSLQDIQYHYWPDESLLKGNPKDHSATLHNSQDNPSGLSHIIIFEDAHPQFAAHGIIYVKTNLDILPKMKMSKGADDHVDDSGATDAAPPTAPPIAVFTQSPRPSNPRYRPSFANYRQCFRFTGYYQITQIEYFEPHSEELIHMLDRKFTRTDRYGNVVQSQRSRENWEWSMANRWAAVTLERDWKGWERPDVKRMERREEGENKDRDDEGKSVNELLRELRMKDE